MCLSSGYKIVIVRLRSYVNIFVLNILSNVSRPHGVESGFSNERPKQVSSGLQANYVLDHITVNKNATDKSPEARKAMK